MQEYIFIYVQRKSYNVDIGPGDSATVTLSTVKNALLDINAKILKLSVLPSGQAICT